MASSLIIKDTHPQKDFTSITQRGLKAYDLAVLYKAEIDLALPGTATTLGDDLAAMGTVVPGAIQTRSEAVAATAAQDALVEAAYTRVRTIRETVRRAGVPLEVRKAYGVGRKASRCVPSVKSALQQIVDRASGAPQEAAELGLTAATVSALQDCITKLMDADLTQEQKRASAPLSTKARNRTARRIMQSVTLIAGAGRLAFADDPAVFASFDALMVGAPRKPASRSRKKDAEKAKGGEEMAATG